MQVHFHINIDDRIIGFFKRNLKGKRGIAVLTTAIIAASGIVFAATTSSNPGYTFFPDDTIRAAEVNANFQELYQAVWELQQNSQGVPPGTIVPYGGPVIGDFKVPDGWLLCNGDSYEITTHQDLYNAIGTSWGTDGKKFRVPDLRGEFLRGVDYGKGLDPDRTGRKNYDGTVVGDIVGSFQSDQIRSHSHSFYAQNQSGGYPSIGSAWSDGSVLSTWGFGGSETRPVNASVNYIIKK